MVSGGAAEVLTAAPEAPALTLRPFPASRALHARIRGRFTNRITWRELAGLTRARIWRRLTGQLAVDDIED